jgi:hypothetical protein
MPKRLPPPTRRPIIQALRTHPWPPCRGSSDIERDTHATDGAPMTEPPDDRGRSLTPLLGPPLAGYIVLVPTLAAEPLLRLALGWPAISEGPTGYEMAAMTLRPDAFAVGMAGLLCFHGLIVRPLLRLARRTAARERVAAMWSGFVVLGVPLGVTWLAARVFFDPTIDTWSEVLVAMAWTIGLPTLGLTLTAAVLQRRSSRPA